MIAWRNIKLHIKGLLIAHSDNKESNLRILKYFKENPKMRKKILKAVDDWLTRNACVESFCKDESVINLCKATTTTPIELYAYVHKFWFVDKTTILANNYDDI
jgi:hypothetical protein